MIGGSTMANKELVPKCLNTEEEICLNAAGYFTPCCWVDSDGERKKNDLIESFFDPSLNIDNHADPVTIIEGEYWNKFMTILKTEPQNAPKLCWHICSGKITTKHIDNTDLKIHF